MYECRGALHKTGNDISMSHIFIVWLQRSKRSHRNHILYQNHFSVSVRVVSNCWMEPQVYFNVPPPKKKQSVEVSYTIFSIFLMTTSISIPLLLLCNLAFELSTIFGRQLRIWRRYVRECSFSKQWPQFTPYKFKCIVFLMVCRLPV